MKKGIIVLGLLVGTAFIVSANGNNETNEDFRGYQNRAESNADGERLRQNVVDPEDCTLEELGTGYLDDDNRKYQNRNNSTVERLRQNAVDPEDCTLDEPGTGYLDEENRKYQNQSKSNGRGKNRRA